MAPPHLEAHRSCPPSFPVQSTDEAPASLPFRHHPSRRSPCARLKPSSGDQKCLHPEYPLGGGGRWSFPQPVRAKHTLNLGKKTISARGLGVTLRTGERASKQTQGSISTVAGATWPWRFRGGGGGQRLPTAPGGTGKAGEVISDTTVPMPLSHQLQRLRTGGSPSLLWAPAPPGAGTDAVYCGLAMQLKPPGWTELPEEEGEPAPTPGQAVSAPGPWEGPVHGSLSGVLTATSPPRLGPRGPECWLQPRSLPGPGLDPAHGVLLGHGAPRPHRRSGMGFQPDL